jgi:rSAM/selenodomain-associated transferase 1
VADRSHYVGAILEARPRTTLGIFVRHPVPGLVKTRLATELGGNRAAEIYSAFIADIVDRFREVAAERTLCFCPGSPESRRYFETIGGRDYRLWPQPDADLGTRMQWFFEDHVRGTGDRAVLIGSDSPTMPGDLVQQAFASLLEVDCVVGPAADGGFYLIGMRNRPWPVFSEVEWSTPRVLDQAIGRIHACGARLALLPPWYDVDTPDDLGMLVDHLRALATAGSPINFAATRRALRLDIENEDGTL